MIAGDTLIHAAARRGDLDAVRHFVEEDRVKVDCRDFLERTPLFAAVDDHARNRFLVQPVVRYLISMGANVEARDSYGETALMYASRHGHAEAVAILLEEGGANVNFCSSSGDTALAVAFWCYDGLRVIPTLLQYGATVSPRKSGLSYGGGSYLHRATRNFKADVGAILNHCRTG